MKKNSSFALLAAALFVLGGCDSYEQDRYVPEVAVESYLEAGRTLPQVKVSTTAPVGAYYRFDDFALRDARVSVSLLAEDGGEEARYAFAETSPGIYAPVQQVDVRPLATYRLEVEAPGFNAPIRSTTTVPGLFGVLSVNADTIAYQGGVQPEVVLSPSAYPLRNQAVYVFSIEARDTTHFALTPVYADWFDQADGDLKKEDLIVNYGGIANEANFRTNADGTINMRVPWIGFAFYGPQTARVYAIDNNLYDFKRSQMTSGTGSPGEMNNLLDAVENGRGIFGSMAGVAVDLFVEASAD